MEKGNTGAMRILHLDHTVSPGGAEIALLRLLKNAPADQSILMIPKETTRGIFAADGLDVRMSGPSQLPGANGLKGRKGALRFAASLIRAAFAVRRSAIFREATVVHANSSRSGLYGALACMGTRKIFVVHVRDRLNSESFAPVPLRALRQLVLPRADLVIANSYSTLDTAASYTRPGAKSVVIPSPMGFVNQTPSLVRPRVASIGMVARLAPWKGQHILIEAFAQAFHNSDVRLLLAGGALFDEESYKQQLEQMVRHLGIADRVDFLGHVPDPWQILRDLDIAVQASVRPEPLGQNVLQYLAAGLPTIATDAGGPAEWIVNGQNGILVPMGSVSDLAQALRRVAKSGELRSQLASSARETKGLMSDADIANAHWEAIQSVAATRADKSETRAAVR